MRTQIKLTEEAKYSYKIGSQEIEGLEAEMHRLMKPVLDVLRDKMYWNREAEFETVEYKSRDGFIAHSHNCGGLMFHAVIPECESMEFGFLSFGEWDGTHYCDETDIENCNCSEAQDGEYDAAIRIWFKFEGIQEDGSLKFYLVVAGGNGDAPYFRTQYEETYFEAEFSCKSISGLKRAAAKHIKAVLKLLK